MATTNVANWDVSHIDANGVYNGDLTGDVTGNVYGPVSTYNSSSAISLTDRASLISGYSEAASFTLADGIQSGQIMRFNCVSVATGSCTLTPSSFGEFTNVVFDAANEYIELVWSENASAWYVISTNATVS